MDELGTGTWWIHIAPTPSVPGSPATREMTLANTPASGEVATGMLLPWSQFDSAKTDFALKITANASAFLRVRASVLIEHGHAGAAGLLAIDLESTVLTFRTCSEILRKRLLGSGGAISGSVSKHLSSIIENLACVIHDVVISTASSDEMRRLAPLAQAFAEEAAGHVRDSFVHIVGSVVDAKIRNGI